MTLLLFIIFSSMDYSADEVFIEIKDNVRIIHARGNLTFKKENFETLADSAIIFESKSVDSLYIFKDIKILSKNLNIFCNKAFYSPVKEYAILENSVKIENDTLLIESEKIFYSSKKDSAFTDKKVLIKNKLKNLKIEGIGMVYLTGKKYGKVDSLIQINIEEKENTIEITGKNLIIFDKSFYVTKDVEIKSKDFFAECDTLVWKDDEILLFGQRPSIKTHDSFLEGNLIKILLKDKKLSKIISERKSLLKSVIEKKDTLSLLSDYLEIFLDDSLRIEKVAAFKNVEGILKR
ncbi:MAG: OstA-like protein [Candidatus Hydrothermales bacterium]